MKILTFNNDLPLQKVVYLTLGDVIKNHDSL